MAKIPRDWRTKSVTVTNPDLMEPGESFKLKAFYSDNDKQLLLSSSMEQVRNEQGETVTRATLHKLRATKRQLAVISWVLKDEDGKDLPFDQDLLLNLPTPLADWLDDEIGRLWDGLGTPVLTTDDGERQQKEARERRATFHGPGVSVAQGPEASGGADDNAGAGDARRGGAGAAH